MAKANRCLFSEEQHLLGGGERHSNTCSLNVPWPRTLRQLAKITREEDERALVSENESVGQIKKNKDF